MDYSPLIISLKTALVSTLITFFLGLFVAYKMSQYKGRFKGIIDGVLNLPLVLPPTVIGFFLLLLFGRNGLIGSLLSYINVQIIFTWTANVIAAVTVSFPMMYKSTRSAFESVDQNLVGASMTLGSSPIRTFWKVILPMSSSGVAAGTILAFARAMGEFGATLMIAGSITGRTKTMPIAIFFASESGNEDEALMWVLIIVFLSLVIMFVMNVIIEKVNRW